MTVPARVQGLITMVQDGQVLEALDTYYASDVSMRENVAAPMQGLAANRARLAASMESIREVTEHRAVQVLVDGDNAAINWHFAFILQDGTRVRFDQWAMQTWGEVDGEARVVEERFVYDPASTAVV